MPAPKITKIYKSDGILKYVLSL